MDTESVVNDARIKRINAIMAVNKKFVPELYEGGSALAVIYVHAKSTNTTSVITSIRYPIWVCLYDAIPDLSCPTLRPNLNMYALYHFSHNLQNPQIILHPS